MIGIDNVKKAVDFILNKEQSGGYSLPDFNAACRMANQDLFRARYGLTEYYQPGRPIPPVAYEVTKKVKDDLRIFKTPVDLSSSSSDFTLPADYVHLTSQMSLEYSSCGEKKKLDKPIELLNDAQLAWRLNDFLTRPTEKHPVCIITGQKLKVYPETITKIRVTYLREPLTPLWVGTTDPDSDELIYSQADSIDFEWPAILENDMVRLVLLYMGVNMRDADIKGYARESQQAGS
jgi:hypothetical protein